MKILTKIKKKAVILQIPSDKRSVILELFEMTHINWLIMTAEIFAEHDVRYCFYDQFGGVADPKMKNKVDKQVHWAADQYLNMLLDTYHLALKDEFEAVKTSGAEIDYEVVFHEVFEVIEGGLCLALYSICDDFEIKSRELDLLIKAKYTEEYHKGSEMEGDELIKDNAIIFWYKEIPYKIIRTLKNNVALDYEDDATYELTKKEERKAISDIKSGRIKEYTSSTIAVMGEMTKLLAQEKAWELEREEDMIERMALKEAMELMIINKEEV